MRACPKCLSVYSTDPEYCSIDGERLMAGNDVDGDPLIGKSLSGYRFEELLGMGGTGCVYRATQFSTGRKCAVKLLFGEMSADRQIPERFRREAEAVSRIKHDHVVEILDWGTADTGSTFLAMEFLEGRTLKEIIEEEAPLMVERAGMLAEQIAAGLAEAHRLGFIHRDLKPGNVIVQVIEGVFEHVKILDFGIVASIRDRGSDSRLTKTGYIVGTPTYMAPEQLDPNAVDTRIDVYSLGVMLYEMLSGKPPFAGSLEQILVAKMMEEPKPLPDAGELGELTLRLLAKEPEDRPLSALHVSADLNRLSILSPEATARAEVPLPMHHEVPFRSTVKVLDEQGEIVASVKPVTGEIQPLDSDELETIEEGQDLPTKVEIELPPSRSDTMLDDRPPFGDQDFEGETLLNGTREMIDGLDAPTSEEQVIDPPTRRIDEPLQEATQSDISLPYDDTTSRDRPGLGEVDPLGDTFLRAPVPIAKERDTYEGERPEMEEPQFPDDTPRYEDDRFDDNIATASGESKWAGDEAQTKETSPVDLETGSLEEPEAVTTSAGSEKAGSEKDSLAPDLGAIDPAEYVDNNETVDAKDTGEIDMPEPSDLPQPIEDVADTPPSGTPAVRETSARPEISPNTKAFEGTQDTRVIEAHRSASDQLQPPPASVLYPPLAKGEKELAKHKKQRLRMAGIVMLVIAVITAALVAAKMFSEETVIIDVPPDKELRE